jgi:hypothetical protein
MKELILIALLNKYKSLGFSQKSFEGVAEYLSKTVTEEAAIETAISGVEPILKSLQSDVDSRAAAIAKAKAEKEKGAEPKEPKEPKTEGDEPPAWAKALIDSNTQLKAELNTMKSGKTFETRKQTLEAKLEKAPAKFKEKILKDFGRMNFEKDEEFDSYLTETETDLTAFNQELADQGLASGRKPFVGGQTKEGVSNGVQAYIDSKDPKKADNLGGKEV